MARFVIRLAGLTLFAIVAASTAARASTHVFVQIGAPVPVAVPAPPPPPPPVVAAPAPYPAYGYVWRPGHYVWTGYGYQLVPGTWVRPPYAGAVWVAPRWTSGPHGAYWVRGYWRH
jgi:hypothetical protein